MIVMILDLFLSYDVVDAPSIIEWTFSEPVLKLFSREYIWECFFNTLDQVTSRSRKVGWSYHADMPWVGACLCVFAGVCAGAREKWVLPCTHFIGAKFVVRYRTLSGVLYDLAIC